MYSFPEPKLNTWTQYYTNFSKCWTCSLRRGESARYFSRSSRSSRFSLSSWTLAFCRVAFVPCNFSSSSDTVLFPCKFRQKHCLFIVNSNYYRNRNSTLRSNVTDKRRNDTGNSGSVVYVTMFCCSQRNTFHSSVSPYGTHPKVCNVLYFIYCLFFQSTKGVY